MIDDVRDRVTKLEDTMNIDYAQQKTLNDLVSTVVVNALGAKKVLHIARLVKRYLQNAVEITKNDLVSMPEQTLLD